jgi:protein gp37
MSQKTKIEWADSTVNFWSGCTKVSAGCAHCYAEALSNRKLGNIGGWGKGAPRKRHRSAFNLALRLNKQPWICDECGMGHAVPGQICMTPDCQCETRHRRRVFSLSLGDWLDPEVPIEWLAEMLDTIRRCDQLEWLLVTKRPELWHSRMEGVRSWCIKDAGESWFDLHLFVHNWFARCDVAPPPNIMVLTSVENQQAADERIPILLDIPAARHGLSCEPLLGPLELENNFQLSGRTRREDKSLTPIGTAKRIDWVIVGGESGTDARICAMDWIADIQRQCAAANVPVFVKQLGKLAVFENANMFDFPDDDKLAAYGQAFASGRLMTLSPKGGDINEWPEQLRVREFPKAV